VAHALEALARFEASHGEAVAIGMVVEARLGESLGITAPGTTERIVHALDRHHLPVALPKNADLASLIDAMRNDKKAREAELRFALPATIGAMHRARDGGYTVAAPEDAVLNALRATQ
jgi:3-dehydroquinate synthase